MLLGKRYQSSLAKKDYDALVIGSGISGLTCAAIMAKQGKKVLVLEQHYTAGGMTHTFKRKTYEWDVGVHYIGDVHRKNSTLLKIFNYITNSKLEWAFMHETYDKVYIKDKVYPFKAPLKNWIEELSQKFPQETQNIKKYVDLVYKVNKSSGAFFAAKCLPFPLNKMISNIFGRSFIKYSKLTTGQVISSITNNKQLASVLTSQYGDYGLPPSQSSFVITAMIAKHYFGGGNYPVGGSLEIAKNIIPIIESTGGMVLTHALVEQIELKGKRVTGVKLTNGDRLKNNCVISSVGAPNTFLNLLPPLSQTEKIRNDLKMVRPSLAHICLYVGINKDLRVDNRENTNLWIYPDYDHDQNIKNYLNQAHSEFPMVYISFPSLKDPCKDKKGPHTSTIEVITMAPFEHYAAWKDTSWKKRGKNYEELKESYAKRLLDKLYEYVPEVKGHVDYYELSTPLSTKHFCMYQHGEIYGLEHTPQRFQLKWLKPKTPIQGLYLTGQDIVTDGVAGALFSGVLTSSWILKKNIISEIKS